MQRLKAFGMMEMIVVLAVMGLLAALAVGFGPGIINKAEAKALKDNLRSLELTQLTNSQNRSYLLDHQEMAKSEPSLSFTEQDASPGVFSVVLSSDGSSVGMAAVTDDGVCVSMLVKSRGSSYATRTSEHKVEPSNPCSGTSALLIESEDW